MTTKADMDEDRYYPELDPRNMLPFSCQLEPDDPNVQRAPSAYIGTDQQVYGGTNYV